MVAAPHLYADHQLKVPVVKRRDYTIYLEQANPTLTFIHCDVYRWSKTVLQNILTDWATLKELHGGPIYALHPPEDEKHLKFLRVVGMKYVSKYTDRRSGLLTHIYST